MRLYKLYIFDLDGTLYRGQEAVPHAVETVRELRQQGAQIRYLTNNSGQTRQAYIDKLVGMGFEANPKDIYSSAIASAKYCDEMGFDEIFAVGEPGLIATLHQAGLRVINANDMGEATSTASAVAKALVVGIHRHFTYDIMLAGMQQVLQGARFIATNADATYPLEQNRLVPGAGAIVASLRTCTGIEPYVVGKPNPYITELVLKDAGVAASDALVVGDRQETDIESGIRAGVDTHLVLTGVTKKAPEGQSASEDLRALLGESIHPPLHGADGIRL